MGLFSGLNYTKGIISTIFVSLICFVYCVNWPLFQNAAERFSFLRKCELHTCVEKTQNRHSLNCMLGVLCDKKKPELKYASLWFNISYFFSNKHSIKPHIFFCVGSLRIHTDPALICQWPFDSTGLFLWECRDVSRAFRSTNPYLLVHLFTFYFTSFLTGWNCLLFWFWANATFSCTIGICFFWQSRDCESEKTG